MRFLSLYLVSLTFFVGCGPEPYSPPRWTPVDPLEIENEMEGGLGILTLEILQRTVDEDLSLPLYLHGLIHGLLQEKNISSETEEQTEWSQREGQLEVGDAALWVRFSCPGPVLDEPNTNFEFGNVQLDGPFMSWGESGSLLATGDLLFRLDACSIGEKQFSGRISAYLSSEESIGALRSDILIRASDGTESHWDAPLLFREGILYYPLALEGGRFIMGVGVFPDPSTLFSLGTADGVFHCRGGGAIECSIPGGPTLRVTR